ncbi:MAG: hypothetical protein ABIQ32_06870 [Sphingomicrobium sp.]
MTRAFILAAAALSVACAFPASAQNGSKTSSGPKASLRELIKKHGFGRTYEWSEYDRLSQLTERGEQLLGSADFDTAVNTLAEEHHIPAKRLKKALTQFLSIVLTNGPNADRASYNQLLLSTQALGDPKLGAQMVAVALYDMKGTECAAGDLTKIMDTFAISRTQAWTIVGKLICPNARTDFLAHYPNSSRAIALRSFGYGGRTAPQDAAFNEWRVRPENLTLIRGDQGPGLVAEWQREHVTSLLMFGLTNEAAEYYKKLPPPDRKELYALQDGLYWSDVDGLREREFQFDKLWIVAEVAMAFRVANHTDIAEEIEKSSLGDLPDRVWACHVEMDEGQCDPKLHASTRTALLLLRYLAHNDDADPYYLAEASSFPRDKLEAGERFGIPYEYCLRLSEARYLSSMCTAAKPLGSWVYGTADPLDLDAKRLNSAILQRHPDILSSLPKYEKTRRQLAKSLLQAKKFEVAKPTLKEALDEKLIEALMAVRPWSRNAIDRQFVLNRAGNRGFIPWWSGGGGEAFRALKNMDGTWKVSEINHWIVD